MKVLVTGGTGLVGRSLKQLCLDWIFISTKDVDLLNLSDTRRYIENIKPDIVVHLAAKVGGLYENMNKNKYMFQDNIDINSNIIKACESVGVKKFIAILSTCIFPDNYKYPLTEDMLHMGPPHTSNFGYAYAKRMLEVQCRLSTMSTVCLVPTNLYGKYDNFDIQSGHVIPALIHKCYLSKKNNKPFVVSGSGKCLRQFMYNEDFCKIIKWSVETNFDNNHELFICTPEEEYSIEYVARTIARKFNQEDIIFDTNFNEGQFKKTASNKKLTSQCDIKFSDIQYKLSDTIDWFINYHEEHNDHS